MPFPTLKGESIQDSLQFALLLLDGVANSDQLLGNVRVASGNLVGQQKGSSGAFLFYSLKPGLQAIKVSSDRYTPYYLPATIAVTVPMPSPQWPAFPDLTLANPDLPLGDPGQTVAYKTQRKTATLLPTTAYPFPEQATLIRGVVEQGGNPLEGAVVTQVGGIDPAYTTGKDGGFVLFVSNPPGLATQVTINAKSAGLADGNVNVTVLRGLTVSLTINM
jgi:hypothetical protein